jgi:hypothetical protein
LSLAGVPLLRRTRAGFVPRPTSEITPLLKAAYGEDPTALQSRLGVIAQALNSGDFATAMIIAVHTRTPELSPEAATRLAKAAAELIKYNYNPDEPRDWHGRWTRDGSPDPASLAATGIEDDQRVDPHSSNHRQRVAENASGTAIDASAPSDGDDDVAAAQPASLEQTFERKYDDLGPVDFAKEVIQFGYWLEGAGRNLPPAELAHALAEYSFLQDRLSAWLAYDYKPPQAQGNLLSAALTLFQGAVNGGIVGPGHLPESMLAVAGTASLFSGNAPARPYKPNIEDPIVVPGQPPKKPALEDAPLPPAQVPKEIEGLGGIAHNREVQIKWGGGIAGQGKPFELYIEKENPEIVRLDPPPNSKGFDHFNPVTREAISTKTMNTLSMSYIKNPQSIFNKLQEYVDQAVNYERYRVSDLDQAKIESKSIYLAVPEWTSPTQWRYLLRAIIYGKDNGVSIVITRIRE